MDDRYEKVVMFGARKIGRRCFHNPNRYYEIVAVLDNYKDSKGNFFDKDIPFIGIDEYKNYYREYEIIIAIRDFHGVEEQLKRQGKVGGHVFIEIHYSFSSHERPWHFF